MRQKFVFYSYLSIPRYAGIKASDIGEFYEGLKRSPSSVIFYHLFHTLFRKHVLQIDYINDFAHWIWKTVREQDLAEELAVFEPLKIKSLRRVKNEILKAVEKFLAADRRLIRVPRGEEFYFMESVSFITPSGISAENEKEFFRKMRNVGLETVFFHLIEARLRLKAFTNDFSEWLEKSCGRKDLAERISAINPYNHTLFEIKMMLEKVGEYV